MTSKRSSEIWRLVIDNLTADEWALERNGCHALFEYGHGSYWYLGDRVSPQVHHVYPAIPIPAPPSPSIWLADFLTNVEIAQAHVGFVVPRTVRSYSKFIKTRLQGCLAGQMVLLFLSKVEFLKFCKFFP